MVLIIEIERMMKTKTLVVMAAGMGSRYGGLKQLDGFGPEGETILEYGIYDAIKAGFSDIVLVIRRATEVFFKEHLLPRIPGNIQVHLAYQELDSFLPSGFSVPGGRTKPWGTGHALLVAREFVKGQLAVINADDYYGPQAMQLLVNFLDTHYDDYALVGYPLKNTVSEHGTVSRGVCEVDEDGKVLDIEEITQIALGEDGLIRYVDDAGNCEQLTGDEWVSMNCWAFQGNIFDYLDSAFEQFLQKEGSSLKSEFFLPFVVDSMVKDKLVDLNLLASSGDWCGVTYPEDKAGVAAKLAESAVNGVYPSPLWRAK